MNINWKSPAIRQRFQEAIWSIIGRWPSIEMINEWFDTDEEEFQHWCIEHARVQWMTGIGIIEAAYLLIEGAFENANIDAEGHIK